MNIKIPVFVVGGLCSILVIYLVASGPDEILRDKARTAHRDGPMAIPDQLRAVLEADAQSIARSEISLTPLPSQRLEMELNSNDAQRQDVAIDKMLLVLALNDAASAALIAERMPVGILRERALRIVAQAWGATDVESALDWAVQLDEDKEAGAALDNVYLGLAGQNPAKAVLMASELGTHEGNLLPILVQQWAEKEPVAALAWVKQQPEGIDRDRLIQRIVFTRSMTDPFHASSLAVKEISSGEFQAATVISVVHQWGRRDLAAADAWVEQFPPGDLKSRARTELESMTKAQAALE